MTTFVLVPGGWHGAWVYEDVAAALRRQGHDPLALTLTGIGERAHLMTARTNLDVHVADVVTAMRSQDVTDAVLCGHSYGGMVITGVADQVAERVARIVYIDAYVPRDGDSCWTLTTDVFRRLFIEGCGADGYSVAPPRGLDRRATGHPLAAFLQRLRLGRRHERIPRRDFIYLSGWSGTPFKAVHERLRRDSRWRVHTVPVGHNIMAEAPHRLGEILNSPG